MKVYAAGPFFNERQLNTIRKVESVLTSFDNIDIYRPRDGAASARKLNKDIGAGKDPDPVTRQQVFRDNIDNIDDSDLLVAVIDDRDIGTIFEMGYACKAGIPIITYTDLGYGMNLMLAESTLAHCKGQEQLYDAIKMFIDAVPRKEFERVFKRANLSEGVEADRNMQLYR